MKEQKKVLDQEELIRVVFECYDAFKEVMRVGSVAEKRAAIEGMNQVNMMMKERVEDFEKKHHIDFKAVEELAKHSNNEFLKGCQEVKERMEKERLELEPLIEKAKQEINRPKTKSYRKRKMESRVRSKE